MTTKGRSDSGVTALLKNSADFGGGCQGRTDRRSMSLPTQYIVIDAEPTVNMKLPTGQMFLVKGLLTGRIQCAYQIKAPPAPDA